MDQKDEIRRLSTEMDELFRDPKLTYFQAGRWLSRNRELIGGVLRSASDAQTLGPLITTASERTSVAK